MIDLDASVKATTGRTLTQIVQGEADRAVRARLLTHLVDQARRWGWTDCESPIPAPIDLFDDATTRPCGECEKCEWHRQAHRLLTRPPIPPAPSEDPEGVAA